MTYPETLRIETGFAPVFETRITPLLSSMEAKRKRLNLLGWLIVAFFAAVAIGISGYVLTSGADSTGAFLIIVFVVALSGLCAYVGRLWLTGSLEAKLAGQVMPVICDFVPNLTYDRAAKANFPTKSLQYNNLVPRHDVASFEDHLAGSYRGIPYDVVELHLQTRETDHEGTTESETVFKGVGVRIALPSDRALDLEEDSPLRDLAEEAGDIEQDGVTLYLSWDRKEGLLALASLSGPVQDSIAQQIHLLFADLDLVHRIIDHILDEAGQGVA
ncbi:MAG: hypothetical protein N4A61_12170 [Pelagimonas sp.]|nr:hypothetical protein [Pelagimonas sp.]